MGAASTSGPLDLARAVGLVNQNDATNDVEGHETVPVSSAQSYINYRRIFGLVWQAFRQEGQDRELQPETVHDILRQADVVPFKTFRVEVGDAEASLRSVKSIHGYKRDQNEMFASLPIEDGCRILRVHAQVSSRDQV